MVRLALNLCLGGAEDKDFGADKWQDFFTEQQKLSSNQYLGAGQ